MKWKTLLISIALMVCGIHAVADDSISIVHAQPSIYEQHMQRMKNNWASLIPTHFLIQNAGNMGVVSIGIGWSYGRRRQWETDLLFGYIPKHDSTRGKLTSTFKGNFIPWSICVNPHGDWAEKGKWNFEPLTTSLYINTVYGHEFWKSQPTRYPDKYYEFMSTKFRLNIAVGQRITFVIPQNKRLLHNRISLFYEVGTCDLYVRSMFQTSIPLKDILGLSVGLKFYTQ